jgi:hypothetical protein
VEGHRPEGGQASKGETPHDRAAPGEVELELTNTQACEQFAKEQGWKV